MDGIESLAALTTRFADLQRRVEAEGIASIRPEWFAMEAATAAFRQEVLLRVHTRMTSSELTTYRAAGDEIDRMLSSMRESRMRLEDAALAREQMAAQRAAADAANALAAAANQQAARMVMWTRILAGATVGLLAATAGLIWATFASGGF